VSFLSVEDLSVRYQSRDGIVEALSRVNLQMGGDDFVVAIGAPGAARPRCCPPSPAFCRPATGKSCLTEPRSPRPGADRGVVFQRHA
jgi:taurine transport system ATP-binding protein